MAPHLAPSMAGNDQRAEATVDGDVRSHGHNMTSGDAG